MVDRLHDLACSGDCRLAERLQLLLRFDALELWRTAGSRDCAHWMDRHLGIRREIALERLRMARLLEELPIIRANFAIGKLSYSQVRAMTRVADASSEIELTAAVLDLSASETIGVCQRWRYREQQGGETPEARESRLALQAFEDRKLHWRRVGEHTIRITLVLPTDSGDEFIAALECVEVDSLAQHDSSAEAATGDATTSTTPAAPATPNARRRRAVIAHDDCCQMAGCSATR